MARFLFFGLIALVVWLIWKKLLNRPSAGGAQPPAERPNAPPPAAPPTADMVPCAHCGLHVPAQEAIRDESGSGIRHYCCPEHQRRGPSAG